MSVTMPIEFGGKILRHASVISTTCLRSCFTPCISMDDGHTVMGDSHIPYTGLALA